MTAFNRGYLGFPRTRPGTREVLAFKSASGGVPDLRFGNGDFDWKRFEFLEFHFLQMQPQNNNQNFEAQISDDGGATYQSGAGAYTALLDEVLGTPSGPTAFSGSTSLWNLNNTGQPTGTNQLLVGNLRIYRPYIYANKYAKSDISFSNTTVNAATRGTLVYTGSTNPWSGIRFFYNTGNIADGAILVEGIRNSK